MGRNPMRRSPRYVQSWTDPEGRTYFYLRKRGLKRIRLPGLPWSPDFMAAYEAALNKVPLQVAEKRTRPGSFSALCVSYYNSTSFKGLVPSTQHTYRLILEKFRAEAAHESVSELTRRDVQRLVDNRSAPFPCSGRMFLKVLRSMMRHAITVEMRDDNPCDGVLAPKAPNKGFHSWTDAEIAQFEAWHPIGTKPRLALALLLNTGQRRSDVVRMGRQHIGPNGLRVKQRKTKQELVIPIHPELARVITATPNNHLTYLVTQFGEPYSSAGFGNAMRDWCDRANLPHCSAHGLRKAQCRRLAEAGCSASQIAAISGHRSLAEVERYVRAAEQSRLAADAMTKLGDVRTA
jgi:integrase